MDYCLQFPVLNVGRKLSNESANDASSRKALIISLFPISREASSAKTTADKLTAGPPKWYAVKGGYAVRDRSVGFSVAIARIDFASGPCISRRPCVC